MEISQYINVSNVFDSNIYDNDFNFFKNNISFQNILFDSLDKCLCEIGLIFFECFIFKEKPLSTVDYHIFEKKDIHLLRICLDGDNLHDFISDSCIAEIPTNFKINLELSRPTYVPILIKPNLTLSIKLLNEKNDLVQLNQDSIYFTRCIFHVRTMSLLQTKILRLRSNDPNNNEIYPTNTPLEFISKIYHSFHQSEDHTSFQIGLDSIFISKAIMQKMKNATLCTLIPGQGYVDTGQVNEMFYSSIKIKNSKKIKSIYLKPNNVIFFNITRRLLDEFPVHLKFFNGATHLKLDKSDVTEDMFILVNFIFRRKFAY